MTTRIGVTGATGRMGGEILSLAGERDDVDVVFAVNRSPDADEVRGVPVSSADEFDALLDRHEPHAVVDFTGPESSVEYARACADAGVAAVIGTTGLDEADEDALREASESTPVLHATNFSRGVRALLAAVEEAVAALPGYDVELTETHHRGKRDAPSGTANTILDRIDETRGEAERVHGRVGEAPREADEIGVHARRAGGVHGEHEVLLAGNDEVLTLAHRAESRAVFAAGALDAAVWLAGQEPGWYDVEAAFGGEGE